MSLIYLNCRAGGSGLAGVPGGPGGPAGQVNQPQQTTIPTSKPRRKFFSRQNMFKSSKDKK